MKVRFKKLRDDAVAPRRAHATDAGYDLVAVSKRFDEYGNIVYGFGLAFEIPRGYGRFLFPRSSLSKLDLSMIDCVGIIDACYRGEVTAKFRPSLMFDRNMVPNAIGSRIYDVGKRVAQLIILPVPDVEFEEAASLSQTDRGSGGYGSTGV